MELKGAQDELSVRRDEITRLCQEVATLRQGLLHMQEEIDKQQPLESVLEEVKCVKQQLEDVQKHNETLLEENQSLQLSVETLEDLQKTSLPQVEATQSELGVLRKKGDSLQDEVISMKSEHESQVN